MYQAILHKHLLRTTAASILDTVLVNLVMHMNFFCWFTFCLNETKFTMFYICCFCVLKDVHNKLKNGIEVEEFHNQESTSLNSGERIGLVRVIMLPADTLLKFYNCKIIHMLIYILCIGKEPSWTSFQEGCNSC